MCDFVPGLAQIFRGFRRVASVVSVIPRGRQGSISLRRGAGNPLSALETLCFWAVLAISLDTIRSLEVSHSEASASGRDGSSPW